MKTAIGYLKSTIFELYTIVYITYFKNCIQLYAIAYNCMQCLSFIMINPHRFIYNNCIQLCTIVCTLVYKCIFLRHRGSPMIQKIPPQFINTIVHIELLRTNTKQQSMIKNMAHLLCNSCAELSFSVHIAH